VGLVALVARADVILVLRPLADARDEAIPDPRALARGERMGVLVPAVEVADDVDALGVRRPDRVERAGDAVHRAGVRSELLVETVVRAFVEEVEVVLREERPRPDRLPGLRGLRG